MSKEAKRPVALLLVFCAAIGLLAGCLSESISITDDVFSISSYREIPQITDDEIEAVEALISSRQSFSFGSFLSKEIFVLPDGSYAGFTPAFCELLSSLFGIPFIPELYDWDVLKSGIDDGTIDFTGEMTPTEERRQSYFMSYPIAQRTLAALTHEDHVTIESEYDLDGLTIGFWEETITARSILDAYRELEFESIEIPDIESVVSGLASGTIDAFVLEVQGVLFAEEYPFIGYTDIAPLVYTPVSLTTSNPELQPIISAVNKYIRAGGIDIIDGLYDEGNIEYSIYSLNRQFNGEERAYLDDLSARGAKVRVALETDNYPISFYDVRAEGFYGIVPDILEEISLLTGIEFEAATDKDSTWPDIMDSLMSGDVAFVSQLIFSEERRDSFAWHDEPYFTSRYAFLSKSDYPNVRAHQVVRSTVGLGRNSAYEHVFKQIFPDHEDVIYYDTQGEMIEGLVKGEIDLLMASESVLLALTHHREEPGYKVNLAFSSPLEESYFGFNVNEAALCGVFSKAMPYIDTEAIGDMWTSRVFDYSRRLAEERALYLTVFVIALVLILFVLAALLTMNYKTKKTTAGQAILLSAIYDSLPLAIFCKDRSGLYTSCNRRFEEFIGQSESEIIGKSIFEIKALDEKSRHDIVGIDRKVLTENTTISSERADVYNGKPRILEVTKTPLIQGGKVTGLLGIEIDIAERKEAEERMKRMMLDLKEATAAAHSANRAKSSFLAKMSHEIRTPMNAIIGMTELALREKEAETKNMHIQTVKQASSNLLAIINDILDFSKIETGNLEIFPAEFSVSSLINDVVSIIRMRVIDSQVRFVVNIDSSIPGTLFGDETRIRQVLLNLLNNAVKYTDRGYVALDVGAVFKGEGDVEIILEVSDTGRGIKREDIVNLFTDFTQFDLDKNRGIEGVGLGLAITQSLVNAMGGKIGVESEYGKGSKFAVMLPQKYMTSAPLTAVDNPGSKNVLIFERREVYADSISRTLEDMGVNYCLVSTGAQLFEKLQGNTYDFIFISFYLYRENEHMLSSFGKNASIALLTEFGEAVSEKKHAVLEMPAYAVPIATVLNGSHDSYSYVDSDESVVRFTAPDARVLIVDDINTNLKVAQGLLLPYGMRTDLCTGGISAVEAVQSKEYDLVFMDHKMPEVDGVEATRRIRDMGSDDTYYRDLPIVALTAHAVSGTRERYLESGFNDFLSKPIDTLKLNSILEKWIPRSKQKGHHKKAGPAAEAEKRVMEIKGLDVVKGISLSGGTMELYLTALSAFYEEGRVKLQDILKCAKDGNLPLYTTHIHGLRSAAAVIGAGEIAERASALEDAGGRGDVEYIEVETNVFADAFDTFLNDINSALSDA